MVAYEILLLAPVPIDRLSFGLGGLGLGVGLVNKIRDHMDFPTARRMYNEIIL